MRDLLKRLIDIGVAALAIAILSPIILAAALAIRIVLGSPVLFRQQRPGLHGRPFIMLKFRSMLNATDRNGEALPDAERLTAFGRFLRASSIDELPSLWNIVRGDMSLVGPRPLLMEYLPLYSAEQARRHQVRPGLTGLAQVSGRNALGWDEKFALDVWYVDHRSLGLDFEILLKTVLKVVGRQGINAEGQATMSKFTGNSGR